MSNDADSDGFVARLRPHQQEKLSPWAKAAIDRYHSNQVAIDNGRLAFPEEHHEAFRAGVKAGSGQYIAYSYIKCQRALEALVRDLSGNTGAASLASYSEARKAVEYFNEDQYARFARRDAAKENE